MNIIGGLCLVSIAYWRRGTLVRQYSHWLTVRCASPIFIPITYYLGFTNRKRKYYEEKTTATLKKETDIDRHGPKPSSNTCQLPNPLHFSLVTTFNCIFQRPYKTPFFAYRPHKVHIQVCGIKKIQVCMLYIGQVYETWSRNWDTERPLSPYISCDLPPLFF